MAQTEAKKSIIRERFEREAAVLETLAQQQPQIPELHAYFCEAGEFYLVQEWIEGETLTQRVQTAPLDSNGSPASTATNPAGIGLCS